MVYLEQFSEGAVLENSARAPYPTPKLGISARHAVSNLSGCGVGAPNPIGNPALSIPRAQEFRGVGVPPKMSFNIPYLVSGLFDLSRFGTLCFPGLRKIRGLAKSPCIWGPYPTPRLGIAAPQAVSNLSACGVGVPHPIETPGR